MDALFTANSTGFYALWDEMADYHSINANSTKSENTVSISTDNIYKERGFTLKKKVEGYFNDAEFKKTSTNIKIWI